jgi:hypothetical protein
VPAGPVEQNVSDLGGDGFGLLPWQRAGLVKQSFGPREERRTDRALVRQYRASIEELLASLSAGQLQLALDIANIPQDIRVFGHVKERHLAAASQVAGADVAVARLTTHRSASRHRRQQGHDLPPHPRRRSP